MHAGDELLGDEHAAGVVVIVGRAVVLGGVRVVGVDERHVGQPPGARVVVELAIGYVMSSYFLLRNSPVIGSP